MKYLHTMLRVVDLEKSLKFYRDGLGFEVVKRDDYPDGKFTLVFLRAGGDVGGASDNVPMIELTHNWDRKEPYDLGTAFGHLAIGVDDIYGICEKLAAAGVKVPRPPGPVKGGTTVIAFIEDPDGYKIELVDRL